MAFPTPSAVSCAGKHPKELECLPWPKTWTETACVVAVLDGLLTSVRTQGKRVTGYVKTRQCLPLDDAGRAAVARTSSVTERVSSNLSDPRRPTQLAHATRRFVHLFDAGCCAQMSLARTHRGEPSSSIGRALSADGPGATRRVMVQW